ncbi:hypothetical protein [uncultured Chitinophaga sp.]|jgi:hypothetical protein|uniref:hypothetical protein n=1 Tax=uncultured Chitinophaga sp. TaxID=339340 RepID=UPI0026376A48|nr:hypothetical protein [uncultured Chitinophaga sp.]
MSFATTYKRLAAVHILHPWYLDTEQQRYYELSAADQDAVLTAQLQTGRYDLLQNMLLEPTPATAALLRGHKMVYRQQAQGLLLGIAVATTTKDGELRYRPQIAPDNNLRLQFYIRIKDPLLLSRSNLRINPVFPAIYYFTNDGSTAGKAFPSLSVPMQDFADGRLYEMGETAVVNGAPSQALTPTHTAAQGWLALTDRQYISEYDRILLPFHFSYRIETAGVEEASFELKQGAAIIKTLSFQRPEGLQEVTLDFRAKGSEAPPENGIYTLAVSGSNNYERTYTIYLNNTLYRPDVWGLLDIVLHTTDPAFSLLDDEGLLAAPAHPVFELRFLNRAAYFKYYFQQKEPPVTDPAWNELPAPAGIRKVIISKQPIPLIRAYQQISYDTVQLPNPDGSLISRQDGRICADTMLTRIKL